jgi:hypothetical protein
VNAVEKSYIRVVVLFLVQLAALYALQHYFM